jgi:sec-independent protein translocase protein TatA
MPELVIILIVALVIFGPKNLPKLGKSLGQTVKNVRDGMEGDDETKKMEAAEEVATVVDELTDEPADVVFCTKCGTKNAADAAFCSKCGEKLA